MATRHNLCQNPACSVSAAGWGGESTPTRVTGLPTGEAGFPVATGARYTSGTFIRTQLGTAVPATEYTLSVYMRPSLFTANGTIYIEWTDSGGGHSYPSTPYTAPLGQTTRIAVTATAPADTVSAAIIVDGLNFATNPADFTAVLIEAAASPPGAYFDGDTPGPPTSAWDGTAGLSSSTYTDAPPGAPEPDWTVTAPRTAWRAGAPRTDWTVGEPYTAWRTSPPRGG